MGVNAEDGPLLSKLADQLADQMADFGDLLNGSLVPNLGGFPFFNEDAVSNQAAEQESSESPCTSVADGSSENLHKSDVARRKTGSDESSFTEALSADNLDLTAAALDFGADPAKSSTSPQAVAKLLPLPGVIAGSKPAPTAQDTRDFCPTPLDMSAAAHDFGTAVERSTVVPKAATKLTPLVSSVAPGMVVSSEAPVLHGVITSEALASPPAASSPRKFPASPQKLPLASVIAGWRSSGGGSSKISSRDVAPSSGEHVPEGNARNSETARRHAAPSSGALAPMDPEESALATLGPEVNPGRRLSALHVGAQLSYPSLEDTTLLTLGDTLRFSQQAHCPDTLEETKPFEFNPERRPSALSMGAVLSYPSLEDSNSFTPCDLLQSAPQARRASCQSRRMSAVPLLGPLNEETSESLEVDSRGRPSGEPPLHSSQEPLAVEVVPADSLALHLKQKGKSSSLSRRKDGSPRKSSSPSRRRDGSPRKSPKSSSSPRKALDSVLLAGLEFTGAHSEGEVPEMTFTHTHV